MEETWKKIEIDTDRKTYFINNYGAVKSKSKRTGFERLIKPWFCRGYLKVRFGLFGKSISVHNLVMLAFVGPRPKGMDINHKNGIKHDNRLSNLEYCTRSYNVSYNFANLGHKMGTLGDHPSAKKVSQYSFIGELIEEYSCIKEASIRTGICRSGISDCCNGKISHSGGFLWRKT